MCCSRSMFRVFGGPDSVSGRLVAGRSFPPQHPSSTSKPRRQGELLRRRGSKEEVSDLSCSSEARHRRLHHFDHRLGRRSRGRCLCRFRRSHRQAEEGSTKRSPRSSRANLVPRAPREPQAQQAPKVTPAHLEAAGGPGPEGKQGLEGEPGEEGSPWTLGGVLPAGATETGVWSASGLEGAEVYVPISFGIPLKAGLNGAKTHVVAAGGEGVCTGTAAEPKAPAGELCVYKQAFSEVSLFGVVNISTQQTGTGKSGAFIALEGVTATSQAYGSWAVTGN